ncbi:MAG: DUF3352 domain-containing protein, partial [Saprospiraceae bacterium]|nr:DUF3352 domain-containing protein [Saprospiraceae bacterium]
MSLENSPNTRTRRMLLALISFLIAALLLYLFLPRNKGLYRAVPAQTSLLLECKGLLRTKILTDKTADPRWREVLRSTLFERCFEDVDAAIRLFKHDPNLLKAFAQDKALVAYTLHPADSLHAFFILELEAEFDLEKSLKTNELTSKFFTHQFHGNDIFTVYLSKTEHLELAVSGRLLLFSRRATLVEDALAQLENAHNWWADRPYLSDLPDATLRVQLRPSALAEQWRNQMNPRWRGLPDMLARNVEWFGLSWDGNEIKTLAETKGFLGNLGSWSETPNNAIFNLLPHNTAFLARTGLSNIPEFFRQIGDGRAGDFEQYVLPWVGAEAAFVITEPLSPALSGDRLLLLAVGDSAKAVNSLRAFGKERGTMPIASGPYQMFEVLAFQSSSLLKPLLGDDEAFRNPVCALLHGYAIFAPDRSSLEIFLDKYLVNHTLATNTDLLQLQQKLPQKGPASFLLNAAYLPGLLHNISAGKTATSLSKTGFFAAELYSGSGRSMEIKLASQALSQPILETDILWKSVIAAPLITQPFLVEQPEGKTFALIQDLKNNLHCLNAQNGENFWSRPLPDPILSDIRGIDFYGNGTKYYTFSTAEQIYTLDEKGRDVQGFPFQLPARATNAVTVVDFDKTQRFNYFVACENGRIYGFGHMGRPLEGWNAFAVQGFVRQPILHFQHKGKDYLAVLTETGLLSVFGRDGALRFPPVQLEGIPEGSEGIVNYFSSLAVDLGSTTPRIYTSNTEGQVFACDLQGKVSTCKVASPGTVAACGQLIGDPRFEWAAFEGKDLTVG